MFSKKTKGLMRGFTLIELLVVIAIIGILASIVLASLNTARNKGADAATKGTLANIRTQAALYYDSNNGFGADSVDATCIVAGSMFFTDPVVKNAITAAGGSSGGTVLCYSDDGTAGAGANAQTWAVSAPCKQTASPYCGVSGAANANWCVDDSGYSGAGKVATLSSNRATCQ